MMVHCRCSLLQKKAQIVLGPTFVALMSHWAACYPALLCFSASVASCALPPCNAHCRCASTAWQTRRPLMRTCSCCTTTMRRKVATRARLGLGPRSVSGPEAWHRRWLAGPGFLLVALQFVKSNERGTEASKPRGCKDARMLCHLASEVSRPLCMCRQGRGWLEPWQRPAEGSASHRPTSDGVQCCPFGCCTGTLRRCTASGPPAAALPAAG